MRINYPPQLPITAAKDDVQAHQVVVVAGDNGSGKTTQLPKMCLEAGRAGTTSLPVARVARASCDQRKGRCGRVGPGLCIRLYSEEDYLSRPEFTLPEIPRSNLAAYSFTSRISTSLPL